MPLTIPPFAVYQAALVAVPARTNHPPPEGEKFIAIEIDWGVTVPIGQAVQISLGSGPVDFSQLVAVSIDNGRNGGDVSMIFPDTGRQLTVPAYSQGVYPVFTNALTFYVISETAVVSDITEIELLNFTPPPVSVLPAQEQSHASVSGIDPQVGTTTLIPPPTAGTLQNININLISNTAAAATIAWNISDGAGNILWATVSTVPAGAYQQDIPISGLRLRFTGGVFLHIVSSSFPVGQAQLNINLYYSVP